MKWICTTALIVVILGITPKAYASMLEVGPDKAFATIESAYKQAVEGDTIEVHPNRDNKAYERSALNVKKKNIAFRAAAPGVKISGIGFEYSGRGSTPRAIFQFDEGADGCMVEGFELFGAHNREKNGAGVRINGANNILIKGCDIHDNDNGIMSNGNGAGLAGVNQKIEYCRIHHNGVDEYSHNLYLDGESVVISFCEISNSSYGHNLKNRARFILVQYCYIHDAANRELDIVDSKGTGRSRSDAVLVGNIIVKDPLSSGNKQVIHFGEDGKYSRNGVIYMVHNTIVTPFSAPVLLLSSSDAGANLVGNLVYYNGKQNAGPVVGISGLANLENVTGELNMFSEGFSFAGTHLGATNVPDVIRAQPFKNELDNDYRPSYPLPHSWPATFGFLPGLPPPIKYDGDGLIAWQYKHPAGKDKRPPEDELTVGAYGYEKASDKNQ